MCGSDMARLCEDRHASATAVQALNKTAATDKICEKRKESRIIFVELKSFLDRESKPGNYSGSSTGASETQDNSYKVPDQS